MASDYIYKNYFDSLFNNWCHQYTILIRLKGLYPANIFIQVTAFIQTWNTEKARKPFYYYFQCKRQKNDNFLSVYLHRSQSEQHLQGAHEVSDREKKEINLFTANNEGNIFQNKNVPEIMFVVL